MESQIYREAYTFSVRVMKAYAYLTEEKHEFEIAKQFKRSGTSNAQPLTFTINTI